jgi:hypothetical protein
LLTKTYRLFHDLRRAERGVGGKLHPFGTRGSLHPLLGAFWSVGAFNHKLGIRPFGEDAEAKRMLAFGNVNEDPLVELARFEVVLKSVSWTIHWFD